MSDSIVITLIIVGALVTVGVVYLLKDRFGSGSFSASVQAHEASGSSVSGNKIKGNGHVLSAKNGAKLDKNEVEGEKSRLEGE